MDKKAEGQKCPKCRKVNPAEAKFCMFCGKNMHPAGPNLWPGKILEMKKGFDPQLVVDRILAEVDQRYIQFDPQLVTEKDLREAFTSLGQKSQQIVIRMTGISGLKPLSNKEIAQEAGVRLQSINKTSGLAFFHLALGLRFRKPSEEFKKQIEDNYRSLNELFEEEAAKRTT